MALKPVSANQGETADVVLLRMRDKRKDSIAFLIYRRSGESPLSSGWGKNRTSDRTHGGPGRKVFEP
jgi:hypothetical protein